MDQRFGGMRPYINHPYNYPGYAGYGYGHYGT